MFLPRPLALFAAALLALGLQAGGGAAVASAGRVSAPQARPAPVGRVTEIADGVTYKKVIDKSVPLVYHVLRIDPSLHDLDTTLAKPNLPGFARITAMAKRANALAAVNGDFGLFSRRPAHMYAHDGELFQTSILGLTGKGFGITDGGAPFYFGLTKPAIALVDDTLTIPVVHWNDGKPGADEVDAYSPRGGTLAPPPDDSCSARLVPLDDAWSPAGDGMARAMSVEAIRCGPSPMDVTDGIVLAAKQIGDGADAIKALAADDHVTLSWSVGWSGATDILGGSFVLVEDGANNATGPCSGYLCRHHPRTGVGVTADGTILLIVVEGRSDRSDGVTYKGFADLFLNEGAENALNLDGGGSSTMVINGKIVNRVSDGKERAVSSALLVMP